MRQKISFRAYRKLISCALAILFCGYFASVTLFPHAHIVDGITIVHSHPYKSQPGNYPANHQHSGNGFILIRFISKLITIIPVVFFGIVFARFPENKPLLLRIEIPVLKNYLLGSVHPRAPTA